MKRVAFLFDPSNDWLVEYFSKHFHSSRKYEFHKFYNDKDISGYDIVFVLGYTKLLKGKIFDSNKLLLLIHESDLPNGRGFSPVQWQILQNINNITVCLLKVSSKADMGDICKKMTMSLDGTELYDEIRMKQAQITFKLINYFLTNYPNVNFKKQESKSTFYRKRKPSDSQLNIDQTIRNQFNLLRICNNNDWPAFFEIHGVRYKLKIEKLK
ncbi:hypothetical protein N9O39_00515 [Candidatus Pelagibacter sp.]|jgi:methionyl-tRNA formyltransferase|nr:hypothetical protein [Candidatus Pelagibacter sp.]